MQFPEKWSEGIQYEETHHSMINISFLPGLFILVKYNIKTSEDSVSSYIPFFALVTYPLTSDFMNLFIT